MKYFIVVRDKKKTNLKVLEADHLVDAQKQKEKIMKDGHQGEVVIGYGKDLRAFLNTFTEYRPKNWRDLIK